MTSRKLVSSPTQKLLTLFNDQWNFRIRRLPSLLEFDRMLIDFSRWRLRLSRQTPALIVTREDYGTMPTQQLYDSIQDTISLSKWDNEYMVLILVEGDVRELRDIPSAYYNFAFIGYREMESIINSRHPLAELRDNLAPQLLFSTLAPYETTAPVSGGRFFGREGEIQRLLQSPETNFLILGIRRIGKTSLMKEVRERMTLEYDPDEAKPIIYLDCSDITSTRQFLAEVIQRMDVREHQRLDRQQNLSSYFVRFFERMHKRFRRIPVLLLDEIDQLILQQRGEERELLRVLRNVAMSGHCRYIMAGFRWAKQEIRQFESPLLSFAEPIKLGELTLKQAREMIVVPMTNLGVTFESEQQIVGQIYQETAGLPLLLQNYCRVLVERLDMLPSNERTITLDSLAQVHTDDRVTGFLLESFDESTTPIEKACVFAIVLMQRGDTRPFTLEDIDAALAKHDINLTLDQLEASCKQLELVGTWYRSGQEMRFIAPVFPTLLMQRTKLKHALWKLQQELS